MSDYYVLDENKNPRPATLDEWVAMLKNDAARRVGNNLVKVGDAEVRVSTIFLGLDHQWADGGPPLLFETMVFGGKHDQYQTRCSTWDEAVEQHQVALDLITEEAMAET